MALNERDFFTEKSETRAMFLSCPVARCRHRDTYQIKWVRRAKKERIPQGADERDRAMFTKLRDHLYRVDDFATCSRCKRRFDIPGQSMMFVDEMNAAMNMPDEQE